MAEIQPSEKPLPLRQAEDGSWEVQSDSEQWVKCYTESDARIVSNAPLILEKSHHTVFPDEVIAAQLEETAAMLEKYNFGTASRLFKRRAKSARGEDLED
jgi:hypothetical protein